jgi:hypothetical protein
MKIKNALRAHPDLSTWALLSLGFLLVFVYSARDVALRPTQAAALGLMTVAVAGVCALIVSWEAGPEAEPANLEDEAA